MEIKENISLKPFNTFGIDVNASYYSTFASQDELGQLLKFASGTKGPVLFLGGGSNILFNGNVDGWVLHNEIKGIEQVSEDDNYVYVKAGAGENWHQFVLYCLQRNWAGVENLSLIPGNVGASPMQNIGAYGVEIKDVFYELEAWNLEEKKVYTFSVNDCEFGYRESIFKRKYKDRFVILNVTFRLNKTPKFHTEYGAIREELEKAGVQELSIQAISDAVIRIRSSKLPDPAQIGNAGSFFKNPTVTADRFTELQEQFPGIPGYPSNSSSSTQAALGAEEEEAPDQAGSGVVTPFPVKLAAGWLIEQCGWKGFRRGDAGCHARQALVLVNYGHATGKEIYDLSQEILKSVEKKFNIELEREVNILPPAKPRDFRNQPLN
ncbi:UDP-N-acetylmuramate dehydrogenase [Flavitalea flava]